MTLRVVLAGGGSAGHVNPLLATAHALRDRGHDIVVIGTEEGLEKQLVPADGFELQTIPKVPIPRRPSAQLLHLPGRLRAAVARTSAIIDGADVVVGYGGYVAGPAYVAAHRAGIPFAVQEQNVRAGWANRLGARNAAAVGLSFPGGSLRARRGLTEVTGLPLRSSIVELASLREDAHGAEQARAEGAAFFDLDPAKPTLLVTGGSLGAQSLNDAMAAAATAIPDDIQIIHVTGKGKLERVRETIESSAVRADWRLMEYTDQMAQAIAAADLVLCRAGAGMVAELTTLGVPACYVPFPIGNGEQALNAAAQVSVGGAVLVYDQDFGPQVVIGRIVPLLRDRSRLVQMGRASRSASPGDGAKNFADLIEAIA